MEVEVKGLEEILKNLARMNVEEELENKALNKAGEITRDAIRIEAPVKRGILKENIKLKRPKNGEVLVHTDKAYHAHLIEGGRSGGSTMAMKKGKLQRVTWGPMAPNPFFTRGFETSKGPAKDAMITELKKGLGL
ncbi:hypothetical protein A8F94_17480 [Bacillus sp. FJAT-27225]|uniref:HK97-gp10 family putative phage morphogenesis protein n=1 Tax=Bacillus sp. FJAT-27225 TaxID=1743144 RepID=UPI00080C2CCC|nr:HK97-gp10 family putative phage morphogenesis protein [Bacillus sp. FJAT-27225]OCA84487.1 hypothetical protein A8F94_17480 [Bacillus sp. FJAT-27225]